MAGEERRRDATKESYWLETLEDWSRSGLSCKAYCDRKGLRPSTFGWWKWQLGQRGKWPSQDRDRILPERTFKGTPLPFLPVTVVSAHRPDLKLIVSERYRVEVPRGFDSGTLDRLLTVLDGRVC